MPATTLRATLPAVVLLVLAATGCSVSVDTGSDDPLPASEVADKVESELEEQNPGVEVDDVTCEGDLEREEGAEQVCHGNDRLDDAYAVDVTVTGIDGDTVSLNFDPDPGRTVAVAELEPVVTDKLTELSGGTAPDAVECPDDLRGRVDAQVVCILTAGEDRLETTVTVTSAEGPEVSFDIEVADEPLP